MAAKLIVSILYNNVLEWKFNENLLQSVASMRQFAQKVLSSFFQSFNKSQYKCVINGYIQKIRRHRNDDA